MTKYKMILFDCDGTLVDSEIINARGMSDILLELGHSQYTTDFCLKKFIGCSAVEIIETLTHLQVENPHLALTLMHDRAILLAAQSLKPMNNALHALENIIAPKCIVSNGDRKTVLHFLELTHLNKFFSSDMIFTREQVEKPKPSPDLYLFAAEKMKTFPKDCLVVEDSVIGITAAKRAGMTVIGFTGANSFHKHMEKQILNAGADHIISNLLEVLKYIS